MQVVQDGTRIFRIYEVKAIGYHNLSFRLKRRAQGHLQEIPEILLTASTTPLSYVRSNGDSRSPELSGDPINFLSREILCQLIDINNIVHAIMPYSEVPEISHERN